MQCWSCRTELPAQSRFCPVCGANQASSPEPTSRPDEALPESPKPSWDDQPTRVEAPQGPPAPPPSGPARHQAGATPPREAKKGVARPILVAVLAGIVVVGVLATGLLMFMNQSKDLTVEGKPVNNPTAVLDQAAQQVLSLAQSDANSKFTSAQDFQCYFATRAGTNSDAVPVLASLYCGPILHQFGDAGAPFDSVAVKYDTSGEQALAQFSAKGLKDVLDQGVSASEVTLLNAKGDAISASALAPLEPPPPPTIAKNKVAVYPANDRYDTDAFEKDCTPIGIVNGGSGCLESELGATGGSSTDARSAPDGQQVATVTVYCRTDSDWTLRFGTGTRAPRARITCSSGEFVEALAAVGPSTTTAVALAGDAKSGPMIDLGSGDVTGSSVFVENYGVTALSLTTLTNGSISSTAHARDEAFAYTGPDTLTATNPNAWFMAEHEKCKGGGPCLAVSWDLYSSSKPNPWLEFESSQLDVTVGGIPAKYRIARIYGTYTVYIAGVKAGEAETVRVTWSPTGRLRNRDDSSSYDYWTDFSGSFSMTTEIPGTQSESDGSSEGTDSSGDSEF